MGVPSAGRRRGAHLNHLEHHPPARHSAGDSVARTHPFIHSGFILLHRWAQRRTMSRLGTTILIGALLATGTQALGADFWRDVGKDLQDAFSEDNMRETFEPVVQAFSEENMRETFAPLVDVAEDAIDAVQDAFSGENMQDTVAPALQAFSEENMRETFAPLVDVAKNAIDAVLLQDADEDAVDAIEIDVEQPAPAFVDDYIVLSDDGIEQAFQPLVELANWTIPEIAENITAFFTDNIPLEI